MGCLCDEKCDEVCDEVFFVTLKEVFLRLNLSKARPVDGSPGQKRKILQKIFLIVSGNPYIKNKNMLNLKDIIDNFQLDQDRLGRALFPDHAYPHFALRRLISGKSTLTVKQLVTIADLTGQTLDDLINKDRWKSEKVTEDTVTLVKGGYRAVLDRQTMITKIFREDTLLPETIIHSETILLKDYIKNLNKIVENYDNSIDKN